MRTSFSFSPKDPHHKAAKEGILGWVREANVGVAEDPLSIGIHAHDSKCVIASYISLPGVSTHNIITVAAWSTPATFAWFYLKELLNLKENYGKAVPAAANSSGSLSDHNRISLQCDTASR